ncbi:tachylectin-related carbohydrate-binding protein [Streptomyces sp. NPDC050704]|uniref:aggregation-promoting factor C-terminal-like domain-containing protein n=1 Tax=Streptomyces sp. NPDC050704 TaxID=3157219 RepID=UPI0034465F21
MPKSSKARRAATGALLAGSLSFGLLTASTTTAQAGTECGGSVSVYGLLDDGRLTFSSINPSNGDRLKTLIGPDLGFTPKAMATLNFNTVLVTSTAGALYRIDVQTNNNALVLADTNPITKIADSGWTHDKLAYDGRGHLFGTANGTLIQYLVSQEKPAGSQHIGQRVEIGDGFVLKTLTATGEDRLLATSSDGRLIDYAINSGATQKWTARELRPDGWSGFNQLVSPGGGLYYGRTSAGGMYWYKDADPLDGDGSDIAYHNNDPVDASGWTQSLLSAQPNSYTCTTSLDRDNITEVKAAGRQMMNAYRSSWANTTQWSCLDQLWTKESGWRWNADNPSSTAYGIPQALPGSKMGSAGADWASNPETQIKWGLSYINDRYNTPCGAWNFWQTNNWY